jgi:uncharacterized spore protein YtfJ
MTTLTERLAEFVPTWGAKLAYGDKTSVDGKEILPVALVVFGFGGGEGSGESTELDAPAPSRGEGSGGGGGGYALPIGAYVTTPDGLRFSPNVVALLVVAVPLVSAAGWALSRIAAASR